jgi:hypothetical protein
MNKNEILHALVDSVRKKHPWKISQDKYLEFFKELPREYLDERLAFDNLVEKAKTFKLCNLHLLQVRVEIKLSIDQLIEWELALDKWAEARAHNILPNDIKKLLKEMK